MPKTLDLAHREPVSNDPDYDSNIELMDSYIDKKSKNWFADSESWIKWKVPSLSTDNVFYEVTFRPVLDRPWMECNCPSFNPLELCKHCKWVMWELRQWAFYLFLSSGHQNILEKSTKWVSHFNSRNQWKRDEEMRLHAPSSNRCI